MTVAVKVGCFVPLLFLVSYVSDGIWAGGAEEATAAAVRQIVVEPTVGLLVERSNSEQSNIVLEQR